MQQISPTVWLLFRIRIFDYRLFQKVNRLKDTIAISKFSEKVYVPRKTYFDLTRVKIHKLTITLLKNYYVIPFSMSNSNPVAQFATKGVSAIKSGEIVRTDYYVSFTDYVISTWNYDFWILRPKIS